MERPPLINSNKMIQFFLPLLMIIISIGLYFGFIDPTYKDAKILEAQKQEFDTAVNNANQLTEKRNELISKVNSFPADGVNRLNKLLPDYVDNVRLIMEVDRIALKYGVSIREVQAQGFGISASKDSSSSADFSGSIGSVPKDYDGATLSFSIFSDYPTFKQFIKDLEDNLRITDIERISFSVSQAAKSPDAYQFSVVLRTYWLK